ncbi:MAG: hypothetical protein H0X65_11960 [Gemmatimonadetes bacterium]|nr:hypothetical protein [Gemmatimonadota bacterium]
MSQRPERISERIARQIPAFGGAFVENGVLHVYLTIPDVAAQARAVIADELRRGERGEMNVQFRSARYTFRQLEGWLNGITVARLPSLVFTEVDERNNRLRIGVENAAARDQALEILARTQIPTNALIVEVAARPRLVQSLRDHIRPLRGGTQIIPVYTGWNSEGFCTYGFNVLFQGKRHMVTNSHCTQDQDVHGLGGYIGAIIHQPNIGPWYARNRNTIGTDVRDPHFTQQWWCDSNQARRGCRWSEAALVEINTSDSWDHGGIARPVERVFLPTVVGSLAINSHNARIGLSSTTDNIFQGDVLDKVGRTTGWTAGTVVSSCRHVYLPTGVGTYGLLCSGVVDAGVGRGDSGSPVFVTTPDGKNHLAGILFAGLINAFTGLGEQFYYSRWQDVNWELGEGNLAAVPASYDPGDPGDPWEPCESDPTAVECPV